MYAGVFHTSRDAANVPLCLFISSNPVHRIPRGHRRSLIHLILPRLAQIVAKCLSHLDHLLKVTPRDVVPAVYRLGHRQQLRRLEHIAEFTAIKSISRQILRVRIKVLDNGLFLVAVDVVFAFVELIKEAIGDEAEAGLVQRVETDSIVNAGLQGYVHREDAVGCHDEDAMKVLQVGQQY